MDFTFRMHKSLLGRSHQGDHKITVYGTIYRVWLLLMQNYDERL